MAFGQIKFKKIITDDQVAEYLASSIKHHLENNESVFWLVAGGSSIPVAVSASKILTGSNLKNLSVSLTDERYGPIGHKDSNWQQLHDAGFVLSGARLLPVLEGDNLENTVLSYAGMLSSQIKNCHFSIGLFGIGLDGHTVGILPKVPPPPRKHWLLVMMAGSLNGLQWLRRQSRNSVR